MAGGDRGDNTARCQAQIWPAHWSARGQCPGTVRPNGRCTAYGHRQRPPVPAAGRQTDEELCVICGYGRREHEDDGEMVHDFAARPARADAVMADPGVAITEGVTEARLREALGRLRKRADGMWPVSRNGQLADVALLEAALADALGGEG